MNLRLESPLLATSEVSETVVSHIGHIALVSVILTTIEIVWIVACRIIVFYE